MKKTTTILCLGIALCMLGCSDDDDQVTTTSTVPFSLTASLSPRSSDAEDTGILQGNWDANSQLAVIKTGSSGVPKSILTRKTDSSDTFTGNLSTLVKNENEIAVFYPAAAITANSSDTLTQTLNLSGQDGTLAGITNYDYLWAQCKAGMNETTGSSACEMTSLVTIGKFQFTVNGGSPLNNITWTTQEVITSSLYHLIHQFCLINIEITVITNFFEILNANRINFMAHILFFYKSMPFLQRYIFLIELFVMAS